MADYVIYLKGPEYLAQWIRHTFGYPSVLQKDCPEHRILNECLVKLPSGAQPKTEDMCNIAIEIPFFKAKDPRVYNYLHHTGEVAVIESLKNLFIKNIMEEVGSIDNGSVKTSTLLYMFMEKHGMDENHWYTASQIYYRARKRYFKSTGIKI